MEDSLLDVGETIYCKSTNYNSVWWVSKVVRITPKTAFLENGARIKREPIVSNNRFEAIGDDNSLRQYYTETDELKNLVRKQKIVEAFKITNWGYYDEKTLFKMDALCKKYEESKLQKTTNQ